MAKLAWRELGQRWLDRAGGTVQQESVGGVPVKKRYWLAGNLNVLELTFRGRTFVSEQSALVEVGRAVVRLKQFLKGLDG